MNLLNKKGLVIRHLPRHDEAVLRRCEAAGVATLHEARSSGADGAGNPSDSAGR